MRKALASAVALSALAGLVGACSSTSVTTAPASTTPVTTRQARSVVRMTSATGQDELLLRPSGRVRALVVFMHGLDSDQDQILDASFAPVRTALLHAGYAIVASNAHGDNIGNPVSVVDQRRAIDDARHRVGGVRQVDVLAFSMGGLDALLTAASRRIAALHALALLSPATDQRAFVGTPYAAAASGAFGNPTASEVPALLRRSDPFLQPVSEYRGYAIHFWHSADDRTVPSSQSTRMSAYLATGGVDAPVTPLTGDHGDLSALQPDDVLTLFATPAAT